MYLNIMQLFACIWPIRRLWLFKRVFHWYKEVCTYLFITNGKIYCCRDILSAIRHKVYATTQLPSFPDKTALINNLLQEIHNLPASQGMSLSDRGELVVRFIISGCQWSQAMNGLFHILSDACPISWLRGVVSPSITIHVPVKWRS